MVLAPPSLKFAAWQHYRVAPPGQLIIRFAGAAEEALEYFVIGEKSGEVHLYEMDSLASFEPILVAR